MSRVDEITCLACLATDAPWDGVSARSRADVTHKTHVAASGAELALCSLVRRPDGRWQTSKGGYILLPRLGPPR